jgi:hypothetical protein
MKLRIPIVKHRDCSEFYRNGKLIAWSEIPDWYVQFLWSSPPNEETRIEALKEWHRRGYSE